MARKVIALIDLDPVLKEYCEKIEETQKHLVQQMSFLKKQAQDYHEKFGKEVKPYWRQIEDHLAAKGLVKDYNPDKQHISFSIEENSVILEDCNEEMNPMDFIKRLLT